MRSERILDSEEDRETGDFGPHRTVHDWGCRARICRKVKIVISKFYMKMNILTMQIFATPIGTSGASGRFYDITCKFYGHVVGVLRK